MHFYAKCVGIKNGPSLTSSHSYNSFVMIYVWGDQLDSPCAFIPVKSTAAVIVNKDGYSSLGVITLSNDIWIGRSKTLSNAWKWWHCLALGLRSDDTDSTWITLFKFTDFKTVLDTYEPFERILMQSWINHFVMKSEIIALLKALFIIIRS